MAEIHFDLGTVYVDDEDLPLIAGLVLRPRIRAEADLRYVEFKAQRRTQMLHRWLLNARPGQFVDHINGDGFDNRRANLRLCTHTENMQNRRRHSNNKSGFKGVYFDQRKGKYRAEVKAFKRRYYIGEFKTAEEASAAYVAKAAEVHGQFFRAGA